MFKAFAGCWHHMASSRICAADITTSTMPETHKVVHEMEKYAKHCVDDNGAPVLFVFWFQICIWGRGMLMGGPP